MALRLEAGGGTATHSEVSQRVRTPLSTSLLNFQELAKRRLIYDGRPVVSSETDGRRLIAIQVHTLGESPAEDTLGWKPGENAVQIVWDYPNEKEQRHILTVTDEEGVTSRLAQHPQSKDVIDLSTDHKPTDEVAARIRGVADYLTAELDDAAKPKSPCISYIYS